MEKPKFVYVIYIQTTPEKVWNAIQDPEMTKQYWVCHRNVSDWKPGSRWEHQDYNDPKDVDIVGKVVESIPPKRLVLTWARPADEADESKHARLTFEIEPETDEVRLTVIHEELDTDMHRGISNGWPVVLSSLKTLLETGRPLPMTARRWEKCAHNS